METKYVCQLHKISKHGLRYYEDIGLINPKRKANGYREYSFTDIKKLSSIMLFRYFDLPLEVIEPLLKNRDIDQTLGCLSEELMMMDEQISSLLEKKKLLQKYVNHIKKTKNISKNDIKITKKDKRYAITSKENCFDLDQSFYLSKILFRESGNYIPIETLNLYGNIVKKKGGIEELQPVFLLDGGDKLTNKNLIVIPEGIYAVVVVNGTFDRNEILKEIKHHVNQLGYAMSNFILETYLITFYESMNISEYLTCIEVKAEKTNQ